MEPDDYDYPDPMHDGPDDGPDVPQCPECGETEAIVPGTGEGCWQCEECGEHFSAEHHGRRPDPPDPYDDDYPIDGVGFADPGGNSALRAATRDNPRDRPCPTCGRKNVLTRIDVLRHYQCDRCADRAEGKMGGDY